MQRALTVVFIASLQAGSVATAEPPDGAASDRADTPVSMSLEEAVEIALVRSYRLRSAKLDYEEAREQTDASYSTIWPQLNANASYTRNIVVPNPFAGSSAGDFFGGFDALGWLAYNEQARLDGRPAITLDEFNMRDAAGRTAAGLPPGSGSDNPFFVPNDFNMGLTLTQLLYNGAAFSGIEAAEKFVETTEAGVDVEALAVVSQTAQAFYGALLAREQTEILKKSVERTQETVDDTKKRVAQGVLPQFALLSAEVELANLETQLLRAKNQAEASLDALKTTLGLPPRRRVSLRGALELDDATPSVAPLEEALGEARSQRPDVRRARLSLELLQIQEEVTWAEYLPVLRAVANLGLQGRVPDDRDFLVRDPMNDTGTSFAYRADSNGFFASDYWNPSFNVGLALTWNVFNGFRTSSTLDQNRVQTNRARLQLEQLEDMVQIEVEQARRDLETAQKQIETQARNIERAELNYRHAELRVREGVSTQLELRDASSQLDQSRFAHRQAIHDYLVARVRYDVALGVPPVTTKETP